MDVAPLDRLGVMTGRVGQVGRVGMFLVALSLTAVTPAIVAAQKERGPFARISILHPRDGQTVDFEAGYIRHLDWHQQAKDSWTWYGWNITFGERQRWFVYATFGHAAANLDNPVAPADDQRDNILNVAPHVDYWGNGLYEFLPALSRGTGVPEPTAHLELTSVDLEAGAAKAFESAISARQSTLQGETLWYRMVAGGLSPRYVRLRPRPSLAALLDARGEQTLPDAVNELIAKMTVEILTLRPTMSLGLELPNRK